MYGRDRGRIDATVRSRSPTTARRTTTHLRPGAGELSINHLVPVRGDGAVARVDLADELDGDLEAAQPQEPARDERCVRPVDSRAVGDVLDHPDPGPAVAHPEPLAVREPVRVDGCC